MIYHMDASHTIGTMCKSCFSPFSTPSFNFNACCIKNFKAEANHTPVNFDDRVPDLVWHLPKPAPDKPLYIPIKTC